MNNITSEYTIQCAAIRYKNQLWTMPRPARHHDIIALIHSETGDTDIQGEQGFIAESEGESKFVGRREAAEIAVLAGQIAEGKAELFSEDLW